MKLAIVVEQFNPHGGGAERSAAQIVQELVNRGHKVSVIAAYGPEDGQRLGVSIHRYAARKPRLATSWVGFARWAKKQIVNGSYDASVSITMAVPATVVQPRGGTVRETQARNLALRKTWWSRLVKRMLLWMSPKQQVSLMLERRTLGDPMVKRFATVSRYVKRQLQQHYHVDASRITLIPNAATMPEVSDVQKGQWREQVRKGFQIADDATVYLFAALNPKLKGIQTLLTAIRRLVDRGIPVVVLLVGRVRYGHQHQAANLGIRDHVRIVGTTTQMPPLYAAADVTVLPSYYDPASKVVIESLIMGTPAISTSYNGASDLIVDSSDRPDTPDAPRRGRVIEDPGDDEALARAMAELADPDERRRCAQATRGLSEELSMRVHVDRLETLLQRVK